MADETRHEIPIPADWILKRIQESKKVRLNNVVIEGNLDFSKLNLQIQCIERTESQNERGLTDEAALVKSSIKITNSHFQGSLNISNAIFGKNAIFSRSHFEGDLSFNGVQFEGYADFEGSQFDKNSYFGGAQFKTGADFSSSHFRGHADFNGSQFEGNAYFRDSQFKTGAEFGSSHFREYADFDGAQFERNTYFSSSHFEGDVGFYDAHFEGDAYFRNVQFGGNAYFEGTQFKGDAHFDKAQFDKIIQFGTIEDGRTTFHRSIIFDMCNIHSLYIYAEFLDISQKQISLRYPDLKYFFVPWKSVEDHIRYNNSNDDSAYLAIIKNYNNLGWFEDADQCNYHYRTIRRKKHLNKAQWAIDCIPWLFYGYGIRFYYPLIEMLGLLVVSAIFYMWSGQAKFPDAFGLSAIILTTTTQVGNLTGPCWYLSIIERISGWLLMATFLVALAKKTLR